jgi:tetratricopeptide (TPR) repeat protein
MAAFQKRMLADCAAAAAPGWRALLPWLLAAMVATAPGALAQTAPVKGEVRVETGGGYARIVFHLAEEVEADVRQAGAIVVVGFKRPVDVSGEKIAAEARSYVSASRRDPDGRGVRLALSRKVNVNYMAAGERLYVDLLPESWTGPAPGLPKEVIEELARRAREAEKILKAQRQSVQRKVKQARVRVAVQPTFVRYVFELPDLVPVTSDRGSEELTLTFSAPLKFDLTEARLHKPASVKTIEAKESEEAVAIRMTIEGATDIRSFREDNNYVVDIGIAEGGEVVIPPRAAAPAKGPNGPPAGVSPPPTVPAKPSAQNEPAAPMRTGEQPKPSGAKTAEGNGAPYETAAGPAPAMRADAQQPPAPAKPAAPAVAEAPKAAARMASLPAAAPAAVQDSMPRAAAADVKPAAPGADASPAAAVAPDGGVVAQLSREGDSVRLHFPFAKPTPAAVFRRASTLWIVFDSKAALDVAGLEGDTSGTIRKIEVKPSQDGQVVRVQLERPRLVGARLDQATWTVSIGDAVTEETRPLGLMRNVAGTKRPSVTIPFDRPREAHKIVDPEIGDTMLVVTGFGPARGFLKPQDFVDFRALPSTHGVALQPFADDVLMELSADKIIVSRPQGLTLSGIAVSSKNTAAYRPMVFDAQLWGFDRQSGFTRRQYNLIAAAADAAEDRRAGPRLDLARFYLAREMFVEAKAVLDVAISDDKSVVEGGTALVMRAIANIMLNRPNEALKDLGHSVVGDNHDAPLWRAFAYARMGKWKEARQGFTNVEQAIATLPVELQRLALKEAMRSTIEVHDYQAAAKQASEFETVGLPAEMRPAVEVLHGRLAQGLGKTEDALKHFRAAADSPDRPAAAQGKLRELALRYELGDLKRGEMIAELETLTSLWRGDETEIEALHKLARLYTQEHRYRDAFHVMRTALRAHPNSDMTQRIQDEAAITFDSLFLAGKGDALPAIDALSLFYDFRELTPIGRRGDEMIRRLADRLVSVDLLAQAAELLQHQIDHRLQGAARAQVATRLAVIYLMDNKPDKAQHVIRQTRMAELSTELRHLRLLLEARALSDLGRHDVALDVIGNIALPEAVRLRADILWAAKRYTESAEQIEVLHGDSWKSFEPLSDPERADILRAAIGYALGEDVIGVARLRERYGAKMAESPERRAFEIATSPMGLQAAEFRDVAKLVAFDTLENFLREMRGRFPEIGALSPVEALPPRQSRSRKPLADMRATGSVIPVAQRAAH